MTLHTKVGGVWREVVDSPFTKVGGAWRTVDTGHVKVSGTWRQFYVRDTTGPATPTAGVATWSNGNLLLSWTNPPDSDYARVEIHRVRDPAAGTAAYLDGLVTTQYGSASQAMSWTDTNIVNDYMWYQYWIYPVDVRNNYGSPLIVNSMGWTGTPRGRVPSPISFFPTDSGTYRNGVWRTDGTVLDQYGNYARVVQGYTSTGMNYAHFFHGTQIYDTLYGTTASSMVLTLNRVNSGGAGGAVYPHVWGSDKSSKSGDGSVGLIGNTLYGTGLCRNGTCAAFNTFTLPTGWHEYFFNLSPTGGFRMRTVGFYSTDTTIQSYGTSASYMVMFSAYEAGYGVAPGQITVTHSG